MESGDRRLDDGKLREVLLSVVRSHGDVTKRVGRNPRAGIVVVARGRVVDARGAERKSLDVGPRNGLLAEEKPKLRS